jgi:hypothetical protein
LLKGSTIVVDRDRSDSEGDLFLPVGGLLRERAEWQEIADRVGDRSLLGGSAGDEAEGMEPDATAGSDAGRTRTWKMMGALRDSDSSIFSP